MKTKLMTMVAALGLALASNGRANLLITGIFDGDLSGGLPKGVELFVLNDIADLSIYGIGSANNGGGTDNEEFTLSGTATAGDYIYIASEATGFNTWFGFSPTFTNSAASINGDDAIELFQNGSVIDVFGDINSTTGFNYADGWAYRIDNTGPDGTTFNASNWSINAGAFDTFTSNAGASNPMPIGTYAIPEPSVAAMLLIGMGFLFRFFRKQK
ncbi:MAG: PEP-CTERM sorting domain-containing protein [Kiritimatiellia bacterium]